MADACLRRGNFSRPREGVNTKRANIPAILIASISIASVILTTGRVALCADLVGRVLNSRGQAVSGVTVKVVNEKDIDAGKGTSDASGAYAITNLSPGTYKLNILPGQWVMSYIGDKGLTVNWGLAPHSPPVAVATLGTAADVSAPAGALSSRISHTQSAPEAVGSGIVQGTTN
jgi:hypothetical protein